MESKKGAKKCMDTTARDYMPGSTSGVSEASITTILFYVAKMLFATEICSQTTYL